MAPTPKKINGLAVDARKMPLEIQEELVKRGLIPFVPGNKGEVNSRELPEDENKPEENEGELPGGKGELKL